MKKIGARLKRARIARDVTQAQVAKALGVTQAFLSMVEEGVRVPSDSQAAKMLDWISGGATPG
jgi:transcriptional regulator with XRE-family HTH domain